MWLEEVSEGKEQERRSESFRGLSHMGPGRSWEVASTLVITATITFILLSCPPRTLHPWTQPSRTPWQAYTHLLRPQRPLSWGRCSTSWTLTSRGTG